MVQSARTIRAPRAWSTPEKRTYGRTVQPGVRALERFAAVDGAGKGRIVNEFKGPAHWEPSSKSRDSTTRLRDGASNVEGGGVPLDGRVRGDNEFADVSVTNAGGEIAQVQIFRADSVDRRQDTVEDVVKTPVVTGPFHDDHVLRLCHDADQLPVTGRIFA